MTTRAIIIGAPRSGSGKTSVTIGLLRAFARRGIKVRGIKTGPDYIDPGFHAFATGTSGLNLGRLGHAAGIASTPVVAAG